MIHPVRDRELVRSYLEERSPRAFERLVRRTLPSVHRLVRRSRLPANDHDDVIQDVYLAVLGSIERFDPTRNFNAWVLGITRNKILSTGVRIERKSGDASDTLSSEESEGLASAEARELQRELRSGIAKLPSNYRRIIELHYEQHLSLTEIATRLATNPSTVRTRLSRALEQLRNVLPPSLVPLALVWLGGSDAIATWLHDRRRPLWSPKRWASEPLLLAATMVAVVGTAGWLALRTMPPTDAVPPATLEVAHVDRAPREIGRSASVRTDARSSNHSAARTLEPPSTTASSPATMTLTLRDGETGERVPYLMFAVQYLRDGPASAAQSYADYRPVVADADGRVVLSDIEQGRIRLRFAPTVGSEILDLQGDVERTIDVFGVRTVEGRVVEADLPADGAEIWCASAIIGAFTPPRCVAHTDAEGRFVIALGGAAPMTLWARVPGRSFSNVALIDNRDRSKVRETTLTLAAASGRIVGTVRDENGLPVASADVVAHEQRGWPDRTPQFVTRTDAEGRYELSTLPSADYHVYATSETGACAAGGTAVLSGTVEYDFELDAGGTIAGRLVDGQGRPIEGWLVAACPTRRERGWHHSLLWRQTLTDADGRFRLSSVLPGSAIATALAPDSGAVHENVALAIESGSKTDWFPSIDRAIVLRKNSRYWQYANWLTRLDRKRARLPGGQPDPR